MARFEKGSIPHNIKNWDYVDYIIREYYPTEGSEIVAIMLNTSRTVVCSRASKIGVKCSKKYKLSKEHKLKISHKLKGLQKNEEWCEKLSKSLKGKKHSKKRLRAIVDGLKRSRKLPRKMTKPESVTQEILVSMFGQYNPYEYTGNRKFWITFKDGKQKNPDFTFKKDKKVIEVFGRYWHKSSEEKILINKYKRIGWECIVIWEDEFDINTVDRLLKFTFPFEYTNEFTLTNQCRT